LASQVGGAIRGLHSAELHRELKIARDIQLQLLPRRCPQHQELEIVASCQPAGSVGGDYFDFFEGEGRRLWMVVADVSGHGVGAALMMATARTVLRAEAEVLDSPAGLLRRINRKLHADLVRAGHFLTLVCLAYDPKDGSLCYASAGHPPPVLRREDGEVMVLDAHGLVIGVMDDFLFEEETVEMRPGDVLAVYTDGLTESRDGVGELFLEERLRLLLADKGKRDAAEWHREILSSLQKFLSGSESQDDVTLLVVRSHRPREITSHLSKEPPRGAAKR
jgi:sigma-B regulation protein RsbU (phosphoserine phosphatase)